MVQNLGVAVPVGANKVLSNKDNGTNQVCTGTPQLTFPATMKRGWGCAIKGEFTFVGTGANGFALINDLRDVGATTSICVVQESGVGIYDLIGRKA